MVAAPQGGSIANIGNTGYGYSYPDEYAADGLEGWIAPRFFYNVGMNNLLHLGEAHGEAVKDYINSFDVNSDPFDRKTVEQWMLMGDPSLETGGHHQFA